MERGVDGQASLRVLVELLEFVTAPCQELHGARVRVLLAERWRVQAVHPADAGRVAVVMHVDEDDG